MFRLKNNSGRFFIYLVVILIAGEIGLRLLLPFEEKRTHYFLTRDVFQHTPSNIHFDSELGFFNNSNIEFIFNSPDFRTKITTNSQGFRDNEESLVNPEILFLGDSFGFGWGVEDNKTCAFFLEELTGKSVLNMGVSGFGTIQEFLLLRRFTRDRDMCGKTAVFLFCPNDLRDSTGHGLPYPVVYRDKNGFTKYRKVKESDFKDWLLNAEKARLPDFYRYSYLAYGVRAAARRIKQFIIKEKYQNSLKSAQEQERIFRLVIKDIKSFSREKGINIVFVYIPNYILTGDDKEIFNVIKPVLDEQKIPFLDLRPALEKEDYWHYDEHWRVSGHFKTAQAIKKFLEKIIE
jgi:hypothetical protein